MELPFEDREHAGRLLAERLEELAGAPDVIVLGLPRGGVEVAAVIAARLDLPLETFVVRKVGVPGHEELAMGAIASGGARVMNEDLLQMLAISSQAVDYAVKEEMAELVRRERAYGTSGLGPRLTGKRIVLVDDGVATGATMRVALSALRQLEARELIVAVPVAPPDTVETLRRESDEVVALATPEPFGAVGRWYRLFPQTSDDQVRHLLEEARRRRGEGSDAPSTRKGRGE